MRRISTALAALLLALGIAAAGAGATTDITVTVNTTATAFTVGDGLCSLAEAVAFANGTPESDCSSAAPTGMTTIDIPAGTYVIPGTLMLSANVAIVGAGAAATEISGNGNFQVFNVSSGTTAAITGVTVEDGLSGVPSTGCIPITHYCPAENGDNGGGIYNAGELTLTDDAVSGNATSAGTAPRSGIAIGCVGNCEPEAGQAAGNGGFGGGVYNDDGATLTVTGSSFTLNTTGAGGNGTDGVSGTGTDASDGQSGGDGGQAGYGAAIASIGTLNVSDSSFAYNVTGTSGLGGNGSNATDANGNGGAGGNAGNAGAGGAIYNGGGLTLTNSTLYYNSTGSGANGGSGGQGSGTGVAGYGGAYAIGGLGGGIDNDGGPAQLTNVTLSDNAVSDAASGGAIWDKASPMRLTFVTIAGNAASFQGGGLYTVTGAVTVTDSIIADNSAFQGYNCSSSTLIDGGGNITYGTDDSCPGKFADPQIGALADNGGPVQTRALAPTSPAVDLVSAGACAGVSTDARGVARPQGAGCDAGAYELAPPDLAGVGTAVTADSATVHASITPNFKDTQVTVDYGAGSAYGSQTHVQDVGAGGGATSFAAALTGLRPNTTYHAKLVATNGDGTSSSADLTFTTKPVASVARASGAAAGSVLKLPLTCNYSSAACSGTLKLSSRVTTSGKKVIGVTASAKKPKRRTAVEVVGSGSYSVRAGATQTLALSLNGTGRRLLNSRYRVPATLVMSGALQLTRQVVFAYGRIHARISLRWARAAGSATLKRARLSALPAHARVTVLCRGRGCGFAKRSFAARGASLTLSARLGHHALAARAVLSFEVTAAGDVGQVAQYRIGAGGAPKLLKRCLVPGARVPSVCA